MATLLVVGPLVSIVPGAQANQNSCDANRDLYSPVVFDHLEPGVMEKHVYALGALEEGELVHIQTLATNPNARIYAHLYRQDPDMCRPAIDASVTPNVNHLLGYQGSHELWEAPTDGQYYLKIHAMAGGTDYLLSWQMPGGLGLGTVDVAAPQPSASRLV